MKLLSQQEAPNSVLWDMKGKVKGGETEEETWINWGF
jgi:hypothetical protein